MLSADVEILVVKESHCKVQFGYMDASYQLKGRPLDGHICCKTFPEPRSHGPRDFQSETKNQAFLAAGAGKTMETRLGY